MKCNFLQTIKPFFLDRKVAFLVHEKQEQRNCMLLFMTLTSPIVPSACVIPVLKDKDFFGLSALLPITIPQNLHAGELIPPAPKTSLVPF